MNSVGFKGVLFRTLWVSWQRSVLFQGLNTERSLRGKKKEEEKGGDRCRSDTFDRPAKVEPALIGGSVKTDGSTFT